jgi:uncharacterized protein YbjT (DUF2867 family)
MKNVIILGASGNIATHAIKMLLDSDDINLTLFLRKKSRLQIKDTSQCHIIEGDVLNFEQLKAAITGQDIVYANLAGDLGAMAQNIVKAMNETGVKRIIFISSIEIYNIPLKPVLRPYRQAADVLEASNLDFTVLRPAWYTNSNEVDYEITHKGEPEKGSVVSEKSLAAFITEIIEHPETYVRESLGINKPNS